MRYVAAVGCESDLRSAGALMGAPYRGGTRPRRLRCAGIGLATCGGCDSYVSAIHFPFESHGRATSTALSPSGEKRRRGRMVSAAPRYALTQRLPCKGSWRRRRLRGQPLKKRPGIHRIPGLHTYYLLLITYYLAQCLHTSSPFSASSTIVLPAARSPLRISRAMSVSALLWR